MRLHKNLPKKLVKTNPFFPGKDKQYYKDEIDKEIKEPEHLYLGVDLSAPLNVLVEQFKKQVSIQQQKVKNDPWNYNQEEIYNAKYTDSDNSEDEGMKKLLELQEKKDNFNFYVKVVYFERQIFFWTVCLVRCLWVFFIC